MTEKLKPCPFCGEKLIFNAPVRIMGPKTLFLKCGNSECGAIVSFTNKICNKNPDEAINYWNRRANDEGKTTNENAETTTLTS